MGDVREQLNKLLAGALARKRRSMQSPNPYLEYPVKPNPRYGQNNPHPKLYEIINRNRVSYQQTLESFLQFKDCLLRIPVDEPNQSQDPFWHCVWLPPVDLVALYSFLCLNNPRKYYEIGSGWSTKFARRAILDHSLQTRIVSIDPEPRTEIESICDYVIRKSLEDLSLGTFDDLEANDMLFVDGSHRCCMNSDVTVMFLDVLPRLASGVFVEFHDIFLPYDYPFAWRERWYSEQYLLGTYILAEGNKLDIILPNAFISSDAKLSKVLCPLWNMLGTNAGYGGSFWLRTR
jgi:hypothetical protein